jgi:hypothetical protein
MRPHIVEIGDGPFGIAGIPNEHEAVAGCGREKPGPADREAIEVRGLILLEGSPEMAPRRRAGQAADVHAGPRGGRVQTIAPDDQVRDEELGIENASDQALIERLPGGAPVIAHEDALTERAGIDTAAPDPKPLDRSHRRCGLGRRTPANAVVRAEVDRRVHAGGERVAIGKEREHLGDRKIGDTRPLGRGRSRREKTEGDREETR